KKYEAFLFDLNGTLIDDMQYHIIAWHKILNSLGVPISLKETKEQCYGKNEELLERVLPGKFSAEQKRELSVEKEKQYQQTYKPHLQLISGADFFLEKVFAHNIQMAIGTAAIMFNVDFVLDGLQLHKYFRTIISADDVQLSKPNPETYLKCAEQ
ncbi:HAD family phosphatase, partial [Thermococcus sp. M36]|uniref:HAD family hydrolase n=1 Tax=Thermococcus sp. M36 TaxID=1638261 RepID=UPI00197D8F94